MDYDDLIVAVIELLQREKRVPYRALKRRFDLDDDYIEDLKIDLIEAKQLATDENDRILVWAGGGESTSESLPVSPSLPPESVHTASEPVSYTPPHLAEKILTSRSALEGERKQVTVLFVDIANSTPLAEQLGPESMHTLLNRFFELLLDEVHRYEGTANQFLGDGAMCLFGAPISHEDHARRAVLAALGVQRRIQEWRAALSDQLGVELEVRMGLNSGLVVVGSIGDNLRMDYSAIGDTTNVSARLQTASEPGTILVSDATARLVQGTIQLEPLPPVTVKGKAEPIAVFNVIGALPRRSPISSRGDRTLSEYVGRARELAVLNELFAQVEVDQGQVVGIVAEAGQGKSRFLYEFHQLLEDKPVIYLEGRCLSYGQASPYHPIIDIVRQRCEVVETDGPTIISDKVRMILQEVGMDPEASAPYLLQLLGVKQGTEPIELMTPAAIRAKTLTTLTQMLLKSSERQPLIVEVEDCHWLDKTSQDYLTELVESLAGASILLLTTYRPGYRPPWIEKSYATQIALRRLSTQDSITIIHSARPDKTTLPDQLVQTIVAKSEGNAFFLEELTRVVLEASDPQSGVTIPDTIQGVLSARLDRLPEELKQLLQTASVLGREFSPRLLREVWDGAGSLDASLFELKRLEFLFERSGGEEPVYVFLHALMQDVAYESLLMTYRQALHASAGQALETLYESHLEDAVDRLAYHYSRTDQATKAVEYLTLAAEKAANGYAHTEAVILLQEALRHVVRQTSTDDDSTVLNLAILQAASLFQLGRHQETIDLLLQEQDRLTRLPASSLSVDYYARIGMAYSYQGQRDRAAQSHHLALEEANKCQDTLLMGRALMSIGVEDYFAGRLSRSIGHHQSAVAIFEKFETYRSSLSSAYFNLAISYYFIGDFGAAISMTAEAERVAETIGQRVRLTETIGLRGWIYATQGEWDRGIETCQHALNDAPHAYPAAIVLGWLGYAYLEGGYLTEAIPMLEQAVEQASQYRSRQVQSWFRSYLGDAYRVEEQLEAAQTLACQGLDLAQHIHHPWGVALAQRTLGRIAQASGKFSEAETHFQEALKLSSELQARYDLARIHLDFAALAYDQGIVDNASIHLSTAHTWFAKLDVPKYVERAKKLAREYDVVLREVLLDELSEGGS